MPELPEVETIVSDLNKKIKGDKIVGFWSGWPKAIKELSGKKFAMEIKGRKILEIRRIGKSILIDLSKKSSAASILEKTIYIHLRMTGHLLVKSSKLNLSFANDRFKFQIKNKISNSKIKTNVKKDYFDDRVNQYIRHSWQLKSKNGEEKTIDFSDVRKFAKIILVDSSKLGELSELKNLGIDALDRKFTLNKLREILKNKEKHTVGRTLMDQQVVAGIGNIYRSEILFEAGVDPRRKNSALKETEIILIYQNIKKVLKKAIKMRGTSDSDYRDTFGAPGNFQKVLKVYRRHGKECKKCANIITRIKVDQRSAFICKHCQK